MHPQRLNFVPPSTSRPWPWIPDPDELASIKATPTTHDAFLTLTTTMTKIFSLLFLLPFAHGWIERRMLPSNYRVPTTSLSAKEGAKATANNPCWQDIYDEDCSMDNAYAASFVASEWLKKMPCGEGIEDCDMPENLKVPGNRQEGGVEDVDVMDFLNLKRAPSVKKAGSEGGVAP